MGKFQTFWADTYSAYLNAVHAVIGLIIGWLFRCLRLDGMELLAEILKYILKEIAGEVVKRLFARLFPQRKRVERRCRTSRRR